MTALGIDPSRLHTKPASDNVSDDFESRLSSQNMAGKRSVFFPKAHSSAPVSRKLDSASVSDRASLDDYAEKSAINPDNASLVERSGPSKKKKILVGLGITAGAAVLIGTIAGVADHQKNIKENREKNKDEGEGNFYIKQSRPTHW